MLVAGLLAGSVLALDYSKYSNILFSVVSILSIQLLSRLGLGLGVGLICNLNCGFSLTRN